MKSKKYQFKKLVKVKKNSNQNNGNKCLICNKWGWNCKKKKKENLKTIPNKINSNQKDEKKISITWINSIKKNSN